MSRKGYTTISAWTDTMRWLDKYRRIISKARGLPDARTVSKAEAIDHALRRVVKNGDNWLDHRDAV